VKPDSRTPRFLKRKQYKVMKNNSLEQTESYLRVATQYYKVNQKPLASGDTVTELTKWDKTTIVDDHGKKYLATVPKYNGFCCVPDHINYQQKHGTYYNRYEPVPHLPHETDTNCPNILNFLNHIFGEQIEYGLDYMKLLYEKPLQKLPILCLVNIERNTGKSSFLFLLKAIFGNNMTINTNGDFQSQFNSDWTGKLIIGVDETLLQRKEESERLKNLSTAKDFKSEGKNKDKVEVEFFAKFVLTSNNEDSFIYIDTQEIRYWVRKVPTLQEDIPDFIEIMRAEIPQFLAYLLERKLHVPKAQGRMWFAPSMIHTEALDKLKKYNRSGIEKELQNILVEELQDFGVSEICYTQADLLKKLKESAGIRSITRTKLKNILHDNWGLEQQPNSTYKIYHWEKLPGSDSYDLGQTTYKGRFYRFALDVFDVEPTQPKADTTKAENDNPNDFENLSIYNKSMPL
jgi:hypothetical protein